MITQSTNQMIEMLKIFKLIAYQQETKQLKVKE
jgi:hypothetical protein